MFTVAEEGKLTRLEARITAEVRERQTTGWTPGLKEDLRGAIREWTDVYDLAANPAL